MALDVLTRFVFADSGLSAGLNKANAEIARVAASSPNARRGLQAIEIGARQLAFSATGLTGPLGQVARGILTFSGGSALMLGAVAGIGAVAGAYHLLTARSKELAAEHKRLEATYRTVAIGNDAQLQAAEKYRQALLGVEEQEKKLRSTLTRSVIIGTLIGRPGAGGALEGDIRTAAGNVALSAETARLQSPEVQAQRRGAERLAQLNEEFTLIGRTTAEIAEQKALYDQIPPAIARAIGQAAARNELEADLTRIRQRAALDLQGVAGRAAIGFAGEGAVGIPAFDAAAIQRQIARDVRMTPADIQEQAGRARGLEAGEDPRAAAFAARQQELNAILAASAPRAQVLASQMALLEQEIDRLGASGGDTSQLQAALEHLRQEMGRTGKAATVSAQQFITAGFGLATAFVSGGSPGGILAGIGGIAGLIPGGGTIGAVLGGLGGLFSAMDSSEDRRHRELLTTINQSADRIRGEPQRVTLVMVTPEGQEIGRTEYELNRRSRRDAVQRLPVG